MAKNYYLPKDDSGKAELLEHLANRLPVYAETLEVSALDIAGQRVNASLSGVQAASCSPNPQRHRAA